MPTAPIGSLIASIGIPGEACSTGWFYVGSHFQDTFGAAGEIYLLYNDATGDYGDNTGAYTAHASVTPKAHQAKASCGKAVDLEIRQTPQTPLWDLDTVVTLNPAQITCPATVTVASGLQSVTEPACTSGTALEQVGVELPVFSSVGALSPGTGNRFTVSVDDVHGTDILDKSLPVPRAPVWFGLGDSYSSGFQSYWDQNDQSFSWVARAVSSLNSAYGVPPAWRMTARILARSGATTDEEAAGQLTASAQELGQQLGSWNFASVTGGANDADFAMQAFQDYLKDVFAGQETALNDITDPAKCPNKPVGSGDPVTEDSFLSAVSANAQSAQSTISGNLSTIFSNLRFTDPDVRLVDVLYPYIVDESSACFSSSPGVQSIIDTIDGAHAAADQSVANVHVIDGRALYGASPLSSDLINLAAPGHFSTFSYPHPTEAGEQKIATAAANLFEQPGPTP
jgi:hypothetical protein